MIGGIINQIPLFRVLFEFFFLIVESYIVNIASFRFVFSPCLVSGNINVSGFCSRSRSYLSNPHSTSSSLSVVFLDPSAIHIITPSAPNAPLAPPSSATTATSTTIGTFLAASDSNAKEYRSDQQRGPATPAKAKGIPA